MPNATVYIKEENLKAWEAIGNKSGWVNSLLAAPPVRNVSQGRARPAVSPKKQRQFEKKADQLYRADFPKETLTADHQPRPIEEKTQAALDKKASQVKVVPTDNWGA